MLYMMLPELLVLQGQSKKIIRYSKRTSSVAITVSLCDQSIRDGILIMKSIIDFFLRRSVFLAITSLLYACAANAGGEPVRHSRFGYIVDKQEASTLAKQYPFLGIVPPFWTPETSDIEGLQKHLPDVGRMIKNEREIEIDVSVET